MYSKILVPLDGSPLAEQILPYARLIAAACATPLELLWVNDVEVVQSPARSGEAYLRQAAAKFLAGFTAVEVTDADGKPGEVIVSRAASAANCLIAMSTHGMSGLRRWLLGSVASKVVQAARSPLLLIRPSANVDPVAAVNLKTVFVPLDGSGLAEKALTQAIGLAQKLQLDTQLLRLYTLPNDAYVAADGIIAQGSAQYKEALHNEAQNYLDGKVEALRAQGLANVIGTAMEGDAAGGIIDLAAKTAQSLIVMSTHGRSGIGRWLLGSVAEKVIQYSHVPVLLIRAA